MKKGLKFISLLFAALFTFTALTSCTVKNAKNSDELWEQAMYRQDTEIGQGSITVYVEVEIADSKILLTVHTDKTNLAEALLEYGLISGDDGPYGLYIKSVIGVTADFDTDGAYWGINSNGEMLMVGISAVEIKDGDRYELVYSR